jgi:type I restriction enzyme S subunit
MGQLAELITSGSRNWAEHYATSGPLFIRAQDIKTDRLELGCVAHVELPTKVEGTRTRLRLGDLLVTITGANVTKAALVREELPEAYVSQHVGLVRPVFTDYVIYSYYWLVSPSHGRRILLRDAYGAGKPGLNLNNLHELSIALPPLPEQHRIVAEVERRLSIIDELAAVVAANLKRAERLRQSIFKIAFERKLVPQDPADEPASVLLEKIRAEQAQHEAPGKAVRKTITKVAGKRKKPWTREVQRELFG